MKKVYLSVLFFSLATTPIAAQNATCISAFQEVTQIGHRATDAVNSLAYSIKRLQEYLSKYVNPGVIIGSTVGAGIVFFGFGALAWAGWGLARKHLAKRFPALKDEDND